MSNTYPAECSPQAKVRIPEGIEDIVGTKASNKEKYPYSSLIIGYSFTVPLNEIANEQSFRNMVSAKSKALKKKFCVVKHAEPYNCYEVARIG